MRWKNGRMEVLPSLIKVSLAQFSRQSLNSTLDKQEREFYPGSSIRSEGAARRSRIAGKKHLRRIVPEENFSHIASREKGRNCLPFSKSKKNSGLKEELDGWETKYTDHLGR